MHEVYTSERIPIKSWASDLDEQTLEQAKNLANLPFASRHIALMPDAHLGYGMPIGSVLASDMVVIPNAVGVDIGCGMGATKLNIKDIQDHHLREIWEITKELIPTGSCWHDTPAEDIDMPNLVDPADAPISNSLYESSKFQLGTLGGGNHFLEIQKGSDGHIWLMVHTGSRNLGNRVAKHYNNIAKDLNEFWFSRVPLSHDLAFLPLRSLEGGQYMSEMRYCMDFAKLNRRLILTQLHNTIEAIVGGVEVVEYINKFHNFAQFENHFGKNYHVHRKGSTRAYEGEKGMIPSSMGTPSYIVTGLGNAESFKSCSHGAGRRMSRAQARRELVLEEEQAFLDKGGILHNLNSESKLDESPSAYKDINEVMANQSDLVKIDVELKPLVTLKG